MIQPTNEAETIALFKLAAPLLGWYCVHLQRAFPDAVIENIRGQRLVAEFEYEARNFHYHGHDPAGCDLIICWCNNWPDAPLPVWAIQDCLLPALASRWEPRQIKRTDVKARRNIGRGIGGKIAVGFSCDIDGDADILAWLSRQENKSASIRKAIRGAWLQDGPTLDDVLNEIGGLKTDIALYLNSDRIPLT